MPLCYRTHSTILTFKWGSEGVGVSRFRGVYGWVEMRLKLNTYEMIKDLSSHSSLPWLVGGDINEIFYNYEKKGGVAKNQTVLDTFCVTFEECGLYDLGFS